MFEVGQKVWCAMFGEGEVEKVIALDTQFYVVVRFGDIHECYTSDGKYYSDTVRTLFPYPVEIVKKAVKPSINWEHVAPEFNYLAEDSGGGAFLYGKEPFVTASSVWCAQSDETVEAIVFASYTPGTCDWKDSLIARPKDA